MIAHEALEHYRSDHPSFSIDTASFCAGHDYVLHSEQVQGLVKALEYVLDNCPRAYPEGGKWSIKAEAALNSFKGV